MALKLKYTDEHGILHINMSPTSSPKDPNGNPEPESKVDITDPKFDTINNRFGQYDLFGGKYDGGDSPRSLFRSRYNSIEEELANTPYAFATERTLRLNNNPLVDITIKSRAFTDEASPSKDIEDDRFFNRKIEYDDSLFGPQLDFLRKSSDEEETPAFTVTQLIHAQDRYFDLSGQSKVGDSRDSVVKSTISVRSAPGSGKKERAVKIVDSRTDIEHGAFKILSTEGAETVRKEPLPAALPVPISKRKRESSFAILSETPVASRPSSPRSLPIERSGRVSPFKGRGFREETSRHTTPKTSAANSRAPSPSRRRTNSLSKIDKMAHVATLPPPIHTISRPHSPRNFLKENIEEIRELSEINREKHEAELERQRLEEEEALLKEMGLMNKNGKSDSLKSLVASRAASRSNSPSKINLRSRSNSPSAILHFEKIPADSKEFISTEVSSKPVTHNSRLRSVSKSQPQSNNVSPKHSKIPKRQSSVSPPRIGVKRDVSNSRKPMENNLNRSQRFMSNSTSSIHETIKIGSQVHDKRAMSKSTQHLSISPAVKGKPPISPGRGGPPPSNRAINAKRLSPIVGTPNKSPVEDSKPGSARTTQRPVATARKPVKTAGNTPATSRLNSRQPSRAVSRDQSPDKRKTLNKPTTAKTSKPLTSKPVNRSVSVKTPQKPVVASKPETKKPMNRTNSMKSLVRTPSTRTLNEKPPLVKKGSKKDIPVKAQSTSKINELGIKKDDDDKKTSRTSATKEGKVNKENAKTSTDSGTNMDEVMKQDNETQYDKITNEKGEIVLLTKKSIISMTTAAITAQPLEVVTTVTNQLPAALEKAREKGMFERLNSKDSIAGKEDIKESKEEKKEPAKTAAKKISEAKEKHEEKDKKEATTKLDKPTTEKKASELITSSTVFIDDNVKLKPLQPPYNNPQVERVKQKIDNILRSPEVSTEKILAETKIKEAKKALKEETEKAKEEIAAAKEDATKKVEEIKEDIVKAPVKEIEKATEEIRSEASKIVDSIITPVEEPKPVVKPKEEVKKTIEPIVTVVNEKTNGPSKEVEKITETLVKGDPEVEVQSSNMSSPAADKMAVENKMAENGSDKSTHSNGGFPQSTSTTPKPPARAHRKESEEETPPLEEQAHKKPNICSRLMGKCKKCCACCGKPEPDDDMEQIQESEKKRGVMSRLNCCRKKDKDTISDIERAAGKASTIEFESETKRKRKLRDILCGCCGRRRRVSDVSAVDAGDGTVGGGGCCGRGRSAVDRRDSILSDEPPTLCCNNRLCNWFRGACRRQPEPSSRRPSMFSKNKSLSPTLPPEDTRPKLDPSLIEHTSVMRGAIPVLPAVLAYFCLMCNVIVPGLGTIFSGMFCLCFGIPRFGVHDGAKHRIGSFVINLLVGAGQVFTVLFCLVGWGWSIWWGVILVKISRKYRKLKAEAKAEEVEAAPPVTSNNHTRA